MPPRAAVHVAASSSDTHSQSQSPEQHTDEMTPLPNLQERQRGIKTLLHDVLLPLRELKEQPFVPQQLQKKYRVTSFRRLDFHTGRVVAGMKPAPSPMSDQYIIPMTPAKVQDFLAMTRAVNIEQDITSKRPHPDRRWEAYYNWGLIKTHLTQHKDDDKLGFLLTDTPWHNMLYTHDFMIRFIERKSPDKIHWQVMGIYQQAFRGPSNNEMHDRPLNPDKPHIVAYLTLDSELQEGTVMASELTVLMYFATNISLLPLFQKHRFYPVTVISASGRTWRITQCIFDITRMTFEIRQTPCVQVQQSVWEKKSDYLTLLGWLVGDAVGKTV